MRSRTALRRLLSTAAAVALATTGLTATLGADQSAAVPGGGAAKLSVRLARLSAPALTSASGRAQAKAVSLPATGAGSLMRRGERLLTYVRVTDTGAATVDALRAAGATIVHVSPDYRVVTAAVAPDHLRRVAGVQTVDYVAEAVAPRVTPSATKRTATRAPSTTAAGCGSATSEGDGVLRADDTRAAYRVDGKGVTVGILSDSWDTGATVTRAADDVASGDLPGPGNPCGRTTAVQVLHDHEGGTDEGRAMGQLVHDLAPGAKLMFATAYDGEYAMADYIVELYRKGATVITDDITYFDEPFYQRGPIGQAVHYVWTKGVVVTSSAGNSNTIFTHPTAGRRDVGAYDSLKFRPATCPAGIPGGKTVKCHDFNGTSKTDTTLSFKLRNGGGMFVDLQIGQPVDGITSDFDLYLIDRGTKQVLAYSDNDSIRAGNSTELLRWANNEGRSMVVDLVVVRASGKGTPALRTVFFDLAGLLGLEQPIGYGGDTVGRYETFGHNADPDLLSVAAADWARPSVGQDYSSRGPSRWLFNTVRTDGKPATPFDKPKVYAKPDLTGVDDVTTTFFYDQGTGGPYHFSGTSAAAPQVAGVAALLRQVKPKASAYEIRESIRTTAVKLRYSAKIVGSGRVDAYAAASKLVPKPAGR